MKTSRLFLPLLLGAMALTSCEDKMDYNEYAIYDKDYIGLNFGNVGGFMTDLYNAIDYDFGNYSSGAFRGSASDESQYSKLGNGIDDFYNGAWGPSNAKNSEWNSMYTAIRTANNFLHEFQGLEFDELKLNADYQAQMHRYKNYPFEVRFLRAYYYFNLVKQYGGVPLVTELLSADETNQLTRNTSDEVFEFIIDECTAIKDSIIQNYSDLGDYTIGEAETGRADNLAVLALRSRAALYYASPLFNPSGDKTRYQDALKYTQELLDAADARKKRLHTKYEDLWSSENFSKSTIVREMLFTRRYYKNSTGDNLVETNNYPVGFEGGTGGNCPTQNLVDAYDMKNGLSIDDPTSGYDPQNPYKNRDPRLEVTVACNGANWPEYDKANILETFVGGANGKPISGATTTGYYLRKLCNGAISLATNGRVKESKHAWVTFRMGEVYLNYAEIAYQLTGSWTAVPNPISETVKDENGNDVTKVYTPTMSALEAVNMIRSRAKVGVFDEAKNPISWERYQKERMVELAFEGHRFWDVRRWKEADKYFKQIKGMEITKDADGKLHYEVKVINNRLWDDKMYLYPLPQSEIQKNPNLEQNPGW